MIQTIGRAARNVNGMAILYADRMTGSMQRAIDETDRRRERQDLHNKKHGIKPATIIKQVADIMEASHPLPKRARGKAAEEAAMYASMTPEQLLKRAAKLEKRMLKHARDLEFEEAARLRDEIQRIRADSLGIADRKAG